MNAVLLAVSFMVTPVRAQQVLNLSCVEALVAVGESRLAGVFAFVAEKDEPAAFADLLVHDKGALKKFVAKADKDFKDANGITQWDRDALAAAVSVFGSPLGETVEKPSAKMVGHLIELTRAPALTLEQLNAKRKK